MLQRVLQRVFGMLFGLALGCGLCECALRVMVHKDADGNQYVRSTHFRPYHLPVHRLNQLLRLYHSSDSMSVVYSPELGWDGRPTFRLVDGRQTFVPGFRASRAPGEYPADPPPDTVRILLFGDSFTACATPESASWGQYLESDLLTHGVAVQVLNFGLGGYGIDQAFLRWRRYGRGYAPDIVIFGFQPENVRRDVNIVRMIYDPNTGLPFSKPRFVAADGRLDAHNVPAAPPDSVPGILKRLPDWPLLSLESAYVAEDYRDHWWLKSSLVALGSAVLRARGSRAAAEEQGAYAAAGEGGALALAIVRRFHDDVDSTGASFVIVHLPRREDLATLIEGKRPLLYSAILDSLERQYTVVDAAVELREAARDGGLEALFRRDSHYDASGNRAVGDALVAYFLKNGAAAHGRRSATPR